MLGFMKNMKNGTELWLTQKAMAEMLNTSQQNISAHITKIFRVNPRFEEMLVQKRSKSKKVLYVNGRPCGIKYYHQELLELIAAKMRGENRQKLNFEML